MAPIAPPGKARRRVYDSPSPNSNKARIALAVACFWPLVLLALFASSAPPVSIDDDGSNTTHTSLRATSWIRDTLDRVDIMGYGPTHPRLAVVIVGDESDKLIASVESVFAHTDLNRVFCVVIVVDGHEEDPTLVPLVRQLVKIDHGAIPHFHGDTADLHVDPKDKGDDEHPHGQKVHVMWSKEKKGLSASRADAVDFLKILQRHHEEAGVKSTAEDLLLLLLHPGAQLMSIKWLPQVTDALIVPPPVLNKGDNNVAYKLANAVALVAEGPGQRTSLDMTLAPKITSPTAEEMNESSGASYMAPALNEAGVVMRLDTYVQLPLQDTSIFLNDWATTVDLTLNLWLCADGIDMLTGVDVKMVDPLPAAPLTPAEAARVAAAWMDEVMTKKFFNAYVKSFPELTYLEWETYQAKAGESATFVDDLTARCRSFPWYVENINHDLQPLLEQAEEVKEEVKDMRKDAPVAAKPERSNREPPPADMGEKKPQRSNREPPPADMGEDEDFKVHDRRDERMPAKPLCDECLKIIEKAQPLDVAYVDVANGHKEHPHMGARDESGNLGYVHDETHLRFNPPPYNFTGDDLRTACMRRDNNYRMLTERVFVDLKGDEEARQSGKKRQKIFCLVYTIEKGHPGIHRIRETWGSKCDGFMVGSTKTDRSIDAVEIPHEGAEEYNNIWQKVRSMWSYIYDNYYEKYDWFHIGGDDLYLIVENLRLYLESEEIQTAQNGGFFLPFGNETQQTPLFMGRRFAYMGNMDDIFISGGSGYTMNKAALKMLVTDLIPNFLPHAHTFSEDTVIAKLFRKRGVFPYETKDEEGSERYMPFMPGHHYGYRMPKDVTKDWYARYSINIKQGPEHSSRRSVAFHYVKENSMYRLHALLYGLCPEGTLVSK